jgi:hypothetical protein
VIFVHEFLASISEIHNQYLNDLEYVAMLTAIFGLHAAKLVGTSAPQAPNRVH